jgi:hypothetical protein
MKSLVLCLALLAVGCPDRSISPIDPVPSAVFTKDIPVSADIDVLFVIDNSRSTQDKQTIFASNFPNFVASLQRFPGGLPNVHLGVVTSTVDIGVATFGTACHPVAGQDGVLQNAPLEATATCQPATTDRFLADVAQPGGSRTRNYTGELPAALSCIAQVGETGCGFEAPLEAMKRALDGSHPENAGFLRTGAFLAVVFLVDEDDCSGKPALFTQGTGVVGSKDFRCTQAAYACDRPIAPDLAGSYTNCKVRHDGLLDDPSEYAQFLSSLQGPSGVAVAVIAGDPQTTIATGTLAPPLPPDFGLQPSCRAVIAGHPAVGRPALRLAGFLGNFGDRGLFSTVCQSDYSQTLDDIGTLLFRAVSPCLEGKIDTDDKDAANPGLQLDCKVSELQDPGSDAQVETLIPPCRMIADQEPDLAGERACWWVKPNAACATETQLELDVERAGAPPPNTTTRVSCAVTAP